MLDTHNSNEIFIVTWRNDVFHMAFRYSDHADIEAGRLRKKLKKEGLSRTNVQVKRIKLIG